MRTRIREVREERGMSQSELARLSGISRQVIWKIETDEETNTTTKTLGAIAKALEVPMNDLIFTASD